MKYIDSTNTVHEVRIIPRTDDAPDLIILTHEFSDKATEITLFDAIADNGYLLLNFGFNAKQGNTYRIAVFSNNKRIFLGQIEAK